MRLIDITKALNNSRVKIFSLIDLEKLLDIDKDNTAYKIAEKLVAEKILARLKNGVYASTQNPPENFEIANALYAPSYISLESALNYYGILSQFPYTTTSITSKKSKKISANNKEYEYSKITPELFWGYQKNDGAIIASPEKALLDMIYLSAKGFRKIDFEELDYSIINKKKFKEICKKVGQPTFHFQLKKVPL